MNVGPGLNPAAPKVSAFKGKAKIAVNCRLGGGTQEW